MDKTNRVVDTVVIGGGPAGYAAAIYAARASLKTVVIEQGMPGGQIATTDIVENYPAIPTITGAELGMKLQEHATEAGAESVYGVVEAIERLDDGSFNVVCADEAYQATAVIVATGARPRTAGFTGEDQFRGRGISYCATCDGMFYRGKNVFVIGGGNMQDYVIVIRAVALSQIDRYILSALFDDLLSIERGHYPVVGGSCGVENEYRISAALVEMQSYSGISGGFAGQRAEQ